MGSQHKFNIKNRDPATELCVLLRHILQLGEGIGLVTSPRLETTIGYCTTNLENAATLGC